MVSVISQSSFKDVSNQVSKSTETIIQTHQHSTACQQKYLGNTTIARSDVSVVLRAGKEYFSATRAIAIGCSTILVTVLEKKYINSNFSWNNFVKHANLVLSTLGVELSRKSEQGGGLQKKFSMTVMLGEGHRRNPDAPSYAFFSNGVNNSPTLYIKYANLRLKNSLIKGADDVLNYLKVHQSDEGEKDLAKQKPLIKTPATAGVDLPPVSLLQDQEEEQGTEVIVREHRKAISVPDVSVVKHRGKDYFSVSGTIYVGKYRIQMKVLERKYGDSSFSWNNFVKHANTTLNTLEAELNQKNKTGEGLRDDFSLVAVLGEGHKRKPSSPRYEFINKGMDNHPTLYIKYANTRLEEFLKKGAVDVYDGLIAQQARAVSENLRSTQYQPPKPQALSRFAKPPMIHSDNTSSTPDTSNAAPSKAKEYPAEIKRFVRQNTVTTVLKINDKVTVSIIFDSDNRSELDDKNIDRHMAAIKQAYREYHRLYTLDGVQGHFNVRLTLSGLDNGYGGGISAPGGEKGTVYISLRKNNPKVSGHEFGHFLDWLDHGYSLKKSSFVREGIAESTMILEDPPSTYRLEWVQKKGIWGSIKHWMHLMEKDSLSSGEKAQLSFLHYSAAPIIFLFLKEKYPKIFNNVEAASERGGAPYPLDIIRKHTTRTMEKAFSRFIDHQFLS